MPKIKSGPAQASSSLASQARLIPHVEKTLSFSQEHIVFTVDQQASPMAELKKRVISYKKDDETASLPIEKTDETPCPSQKKLSDIRVKRKAETARHARRAYEIPPQAKQLFLDYLDKNDIISVIFNLIKIAEENVSFGIKFTWIYMQFNTLYDEYLEKNDIPDYKKILINSLLTPNLIEAFKSINIHKSQFNPIPDDEIKKQYATELGNKDFGIVLRLIYTHNGNDLKSSIEQINRIIDTFYSSYEKTDIAAPLKDLSRNILLKFDDIINGKETLTPSIEERPCTIL